MGQGVDKNGAEGHSYGGWRPGMWGAHVMGHDECGTREGASMQWGLGQVCSRVQRCPQLGMGYHGAWGARALGREVGAMGSEMRVQGRVCIMGYTDACVGGTDVCEMGCVAVRAVMSMLWGTAYPCNGAWKQMRVRCV